MAALQGSALSGARVNSPAFLRGTALRQNAVAVRPSRSAAVPTKAFFGGGGVKQVNGEPMLCIDCGYIYRGDFNALPKDWECPPCGSGGGRTS
jgi:hypothetical protein